MTTTMATYGHTLCSTKRNTTPNTGGVFAVGAKERDSEHRRGFAVGATKQTMDVTDVKRLGGTPLGMVKAYSGPSGVPPVAPVAPGRCPRPLPQYGTRGRTPGPRGSYGSIPSQRWYLFEIVEACLHGEGLWAFLLEVLKYLRQVGVVQIPPCMENI